MFIFISIFACGSKQAEVVEQPKKESYIDKSLLTNITEETINSNNLTIDWELQKTISGLAEKYKVNFTAISVMNAHTGEVLALYGRSNYKEDCSLALESHLAASVFKIVTATAAMEQKGITPESVFVYSGSPYTLYKGQLSDKHYKWSQETTLSTAFAKSNNVVFGKIGSLYLGDTPILLTAIKLGFYKPPIKDAWSMPSMLFMPKDEYGLAELACGFNRRTTISPVHASELVTAVLNNGEMIKPILVRNDKSEKVRVMSEKTAESIKRMMHEAVKMGTLSKGFRGYTKDNVLSELKIGGKSGSINGTDPIGRRSWFVGYGEAPDGQAIAVSCLVIKDGKFYISSDGLARQIIRSYFDRPASFSEAKKMSMKTPEN